MFEKNSPEMIEYNTSSLREMRESLLVLQNSYDAITVIIERLVRSQNSVDQQILEILQVEIQLTSIQIEKLHKLMYHRLLLTEQSS